MRFSFSSKRCFMQILCVCMDTYSNKILYILDVVGGAILAYFLYWMQWTFRSEFNGIFSNDSIVPSKLLCVTKLLLKWTFRTHLLKL